jgi:hypothetical protein
LRRSPGYSGCIRTYGSSLATAQTRRDFACGTPLTRCHQIPCDYKGGKEAALKSLIGQVMKLSKGKANPGLVNDLLKRKLN